MATKRTNVIPFPKIDDPRIDDLLLAAYYMVNTIDNRKAATNPFLQKAVTDLRQAADAICHPAGCGCGSCRAAGR